MPHQRSRAWLCAVLLAPLLCLPAAAGEPEMSPAERVDREMLRLRIQIQNAKVRLELGLVGAIASEEIEPSEPSEPVTPMRSCCEVNLRKMRGAAQELTKAFEELERCHRAEENHDAISALGFARTDLGEFSRVVQILADAASQEEALGALGGLTQLYFRLEESAEGIGACPAPEQAATEPEAEAGAEKKTDEPKTGKKKQKAEKEPGG